MKAVELFSGIGGFRIACDAIGIETVWANDCCPSACKVYSDQFGKNALCEGDVRELLGKIPSHDVLTGGFPCQPFSSAGKKKGIKDPRGTLFNVVVDVLRENRPRFFVLENVKRLLTMERGIHFATILSSLAELNYDIEWRLLNAVHFGLPQNRQRVFIIGKLSETSPSTEMPDAYLPVRLATADDLTTCASIEFREINRWKSWTDISSHGAKFPNWGLAKRGRFYSTQLQQFSLAFPSADLRSVLQDNVSENFDFTESTIDRLGRSEVVERFVEGVEILSNQAGGARMGYTVFGIDGIAPTLTSTASRHYERYRVGDRYRRLTNIEYARIQGFPDDHCSACSVYSQYALFGNAVPPPMAQWAITRLTTNGVLIRDLPERVVQRKLFNAV